MGRRGVLALAGWLAACGGNANVGDSGGPGSESASGEAPEGSQPAAADGTTRGPGREPASSGAGADDGDGGTDGWRPPVPIPSFVEVAAEAGLVHVHGQWSTAPHCLIDQLGPGSNGYCLPERMTAGAAAADFDGDGRVDLAASRVHGRPLLYRNLGDGTFEEVGEAAGIPEHAWGSSGLAWADLDEDGDQDLYVVALGDTRHHLYVNDGTGHFTEEAVARGAALPSTRQHAGMSVAVGDYDLDGFVDLYVGEWRSNEALGDEPSHSRLLRNLGATAPGHFEDVTETAGVVQDDVWIGLTRLAGVYSFAPSFGDLDGDGWPELGVVSDFGCSRLYWNGGDGTFLDGTLFAGVGLDDNGMGSAFGDYDRDGDLDWFVTSITNPEGAPENKLYRNDGDRRFTELAEPLGLGAGGWGWGASFFDPDNDGDLDLMMTNGFYYTDHLAQHAHLWLNQLSGGLSGGPSEGRPGGPAGGAWFGADVAVEAGLGALGQGRGLLVLDHDGDGDLDVYEAINLDAPRLYENLDGDRNDWLRVRARGTVSNRDGLGARVTVRVTEDGPTQLHEIGASIAHYMGQPDKVAHFGLGHGSHPDAGPVAEVRVYWPASGQEQVFTAVERNTELLAIEPEP